jgi:hypothetical protein
MMATILDRSLAAVITVPGDGGMAFDPNRDLFYVIDSTTDEVVAYETGHMAGPVPAAGWRECWAIVQPRRRRDRGERRLTHPLPGDCDGGTGDREPAADGIAGNVGGEPFDVCPCRCAHDLDRARA